MVEHIPGETHLLALSALTWIWMGSELNENNWLQVEVPNIFSLVVWQNAACLGLPIRSIYILRTIKIKNKFAFYISVVFSFACLYCAMKNHLGFWGGIRAKPECSSALNVASDEVPRDQVLVFNTVPVWFQGSCHKACPSSHDLRRKPIPCRETCVSKELQD